MHNIVIIGSAFISCLVVATLALFAGAGLLIRSGRRVLGRSIAVLAVLLSLGTVADLVNAHYGYLPRVADVVGVRSWPEAGPNDAGNGSATGGASAERQRGGVTDLAVLGENSGFGAHNALVYLPPQYFSEPARRFPTVYLLHGSPGAPIDWFRSDRAADVGLAAARAGNPVILVAPRMSRSWTDDSECVNRPQEHIESYLVDDVIPTVDRSLRTQARRQSRALAGNSAGGYCALNLGLRHRDLFDTIIDMSGYSRPTYTGGMRGLFGPGPDLARQVADNDPSHYAARLAVAPRVRLWLDCGRSDAVPLRDIEALAPVLRNRGQDVTVSLRSGGHEHYVWRAALFQSVLWAAPALQGNVGDGATPVRTSRGPGV